MRYRLVSVLVVAAVVFTVTASLGVSKVGVSNAYACDHNYWNVSCGNMDANTGYTVTQARNVGGGWDNINGDGLQATFTTYSTILVIGTTAGGNWLYSHSANYGQEIQVVNLTSWTDKVGCYNNHGTTIWVNCRHWDWD
jgi:hypothetical protein